LESAAQQYKTQFGQYPATLQDLVTHGILKEIPPSPVGRLNVIDPKTGKVSFDTLAPGS
jgi:hypothetical protein